MLLRCFLEAEDEVCSQDPDSWLTSRFRTVNLFPEKISPWNAQRARERASALRVREIAVPDHVILLGRRVADALALDDMDWFEKRVHGTVHYWLAPHPSGLNRKLNDPDTRVRVGRTLQEALAASAAT